jgi:Mrp family chromosome partitioning ATPase
MGMGQRRTRRTWTSISRKRLSDIERAILVGSGKSGVGKTFVSCGLALALVKEGYKTGGLRHRHPRRERPELLRPAVDA